MVRVSTLSLVTPRRCKGTRADGQPCGMPPMADSAFCWSHDPANADAAAEARRVGGLRRKKEGTVASAYSFGGLESVHDIRRLLDIAVVDTLSIENSIQRSRALAYLAQMALRALEVGEVQDRLQVLEGLVLGRRTFHSSMFDEDDEDGDIG
jgi:hypothetical protein